MGHGNGALARRVQSVVDVMRSRDLRRLQLGWGAYFLVDGISMVGLSVWAFRHGGTSAVGIVGLARLLPGAVALPFGAWAADRYSRRRVVSAVFLVMSATQVGDRRGACVGRPRSPRLPARRLQQRRRHALPPGSPGIGAPRCAITSRTGRHERDGRNTRGSGHVPRPGPRRAPPRPQRRAMGRGRPRLLLRPLVG